jgi:hypothetical protein
MNTELTEDNAAFPRVVTPGFDEVATGMTLRDYFAAAALPEVISHLNPADSAILWEHDEDETKPHSDLHLAARWSYLMADAMLEARKKTGAV